VVFSGNWGPSYGGAITNLNGTLTVADSTFFGNSSGYVGGGLTNYCGTATVTNSTFSGNASTGPGGAVYNYCGTLTLVNTTISGNSSSASGAPEYAAAVYNIYAYLNLKNMIFANSGAAGNCFSYPAAWPTTSYGHNLSDDTTCSGFLTAIGDLNNTPAGLDPNGLQNNGGPTPTIALLSSSPAVDAIPVSPTNYCTDVNGNPITTDQSGILRPQGPACDIGAFELVEAGATPTGSNVSVQPAYSGGTPPVTMTFSNVTLAGTSTLTESGTGTPPPTGFKVGNPPTYYDLSTTAVFSGSATVCINYSGIKFGNPSNLRLFHYQNGAWMDVTTSINTATATICSSVTSFSPFAIFESAYTAVVQQPIKADGSSVFNANRGVAPIKFSLALNGLPTCNLPPATISLIQTSGGTNGPVNESSFSQASDNGSNFRIDTINCQYIYNLALLQDYTPRQLGGLRAGAVNQPG
jgi:hypothetical protein